MNDENTIKWLKEHNENDFKEHNILEISDPKEVIMIEKEEYDNLKEENQRLNNVLNELERHLEQEILEWQDVDDEWTKAQVQEDKIILDKLNELKESDK